MTAVEIGCAAGASTRWLSEQGCDAVGLDLVQGVVEQARAAAAAPSLSGTHWIERPPDNDGEGCYSLAEYWFEPGGACRWQLDEEDGGEYEAEGTWRRTAEAVVLELTTVRERSVHRDEEAWTAGKAHTREIASATFTKRYMQCDSTWDEGSTGGAVQAAASAAPTSTSKSVFLQGDVFALPPSISYASAAAAAALEAAAGPGPNIGGAAAGGGAAAAVGGGAADDGFGTFELVFDSQCFHCLREHNEQRAVSTNRTSRRKESLESSLLWLCVERVRTHMHAHAGCA